MQVPPQGLSPTTLPQVNFCAGIEKIRMEFGTWLRSEAFAFYAAEQQPEVLFAAVPNAAVAGASIIAIPAAVPSTAAIQKLHNARTVVG